MKNKKYLSIIFVSVTSSLFISCSTENVTTEDYDTNHYISLTAEVPDSRSRAHWDIADDENNSLTYAWDSSDDEMQSFVLRNKKPVVFTGNKLYSPTTITPDMEVKRYASLEITESLSEEYQNGDIVWAVSPISDNDIRIADGMISVEFNLPDGYVQTDAATTEHLKKYILITGSGTVKDKSAKLKFKVIPAVYRFKIMNNDTEVFNVTEVGITGPFCNKAVIDAFEMPQYSVSSESYTIKVTTGLNGINVAPEGTAYLYALVFPTATSSITENITLYVKGKYGNVLVDDSMHAPCNVVYPNLDLESNKYYDMMVPVLRKGIELSGVGIEEFQPGGEFDIEIDK